MSSSSSDQAIAEEITQLQFLLLLDNYTLLSAFVLWFQDLFLTLPTEIRAIWSSPLTGSSILFVLNRYSFLLHAAIQLAISLPGEMTSISCRNLVVASRVSSSVADAATKLLSILRVYALFGQKRSLFFLLCPFIIVNIVFTFLVCFSATVTTSRGTIAESILPCVVGQDAEIKISTIISPFLQLAFDGIIFILTLVRTVSHVIQSRKSGIQSIAEVVLRDGTLYFFTIFIIASIQAAFALDSIFSGGAVSLIEEQIATVFFSFLAVLPNVLINRFILNLRAFSNTHTIRDCDNSLSDTAPVSSLNFAENRFIGNIGAPLDPDQWDKEDDDDDGGYELDILSRVVDPVTTLVPVIYDYEKGEPVRLVPMLRGSWF